MMLININICAYRCDVDLPIHLDTQIWIASEILNEKIPTNVAEEDKWKLKKSENATLWKQFGMDWRNEEKELSIDDTATPKASEVLTNDVKLNLPNNVEQNFKNL